MLADGSTDPDWVAMDLFSQAEHDELAQSILLSPDAAYLDAVAAAIERLLPSLPRRDVIRASLEGRGALIHTRSMEEACAISNRIAPEHLEISAREPQRWEPLLKHAGAIFLGAFTSESLGDYCAGPNHVLPTSGTARFSSPLGVYDFVKRSSLIEVSAQGAQVLGPIAAELAMGEGLQAHARAAQMRLGAVGDAEHNALSSAHGDRRQRRPADPARSGARISKAWWRSVAKSLAQASVRSPGRPLGIYDGDEPVGLLLLWDVRRDPDEPADQLYVWQLDDRCQAPEEGLRRARDAVGDRRGTATAAWRRSGLSTRCCPDMPGPFYEKLGFRYTGKVEHNEHLMVLPLERGDTVIEPTPLNARMARVIRQDVQSTHGYAIQPSAQADQARRHGKPVSLARGAAARTGRAAVAGGDQPLSGAVRGRRGGRAVAPCRAARGLQS